MKYFVFISYIYDGGEMYGPFDTLDEARAIRDSESSRFTDTWIMYGEEVS